MPRSITTTIENESAKSRLRVVDLLKVVFPDPIGVKYWSKSSWNYNDKDYTPRILSIGSWTRTMSPETEDLTIELGNADGEITKIFRTVNMEFAELTLIRYYPDLEEAIDPLWTGWGGTIKLNEQSAEWNIHFGFRGFRQRGLRMLTGNCWKLFDDGNFCPYDVTKCGKLTADLSLSADVMYTDHPELYASGDIIGIGDELIYVVWGGGNPIVISRGYAGTTPSTHSIYTSHSPSATESPSSSRSPSASATTSLSISVSPSASASASRSPSSSRSPSESESPSASSSLSPSESVSPSTSASPSIPHAPLGSPSLSPSASISPSASTSPSASGSESFSLSPSSSVSASPSPTPFEGGPNYIYHATCQKTKAACLRRMMFGPPQIADGYRYYGGFDLAAPTPKLRPYRTEKGSIREVLYGGVANNPGNQGRIVPAVYGTYRLSNIPAVYCYLDTSSHLGMRKHALGIIAEGECCGVDLNAVLIDNLLHDSTIPPSDYLSMRIFWGSGGQRSCTTYPGAGSLDTYIHNPYQVNGADGNGSSLSDLFCIAMTGQTNQEAWSPDVEEIPSFDVTFAGKKTRTIQGWIDSDPNQWTDSPDPIEVAVDFCVNGKYGPRLALSRIDLSSAKIASDYCRAQVLNTDESTPGYVSRFKFNGALSSDQSSEAILASILDNCNGYYYSEGKKIAFGIRKAEDLDAIDLLTVLSDTGNNRNILREDGRSSLEVEQTSSVDDVANQLDVQFSDITNSYQENIISIYDEAQQTLASLVELGDVSRCVVSKSFSLNGTVTKDQAQRIGVLRLREEYLKSVKYAFKMSLKDSVKLAPGDVRKLTSHTVGSELIKRLADRVYVRIWKIEETDKFTASIEAFLHLNEYYVNEVGTIV
jgi:hypothetical protein